MKQNHIILLYTDQELQAIQRQRESREKGAIFQVLILVVVAVMVIRAIVNFIIRKQRK